MDAVGLHEVSGNLDEKFAVLCRAYVVEPKKVPEVMAVGLNAFRGGIIGTVIAVFVAGSVEAQNDHVGGYVSLDLGDVDGVRTFRSGTAHEEVPQVAISCGGEPQRRGVRVCKDREVPHGAVTKRFGVGPYVYGAVRNEGEDGSGKLRAGGAAS